MGERDFYEPDLSDWDAEERTPQSYRDEIAELRQDIAGNRNENRRYKDYLTDAKYERDQARAELTRLREGGTAIDAAFADRIAALEAALVQIMECPVNSGSQQYSIARKALGLYPSDSDEDA